MYFVKPEASAMHLSWNVSSNTVINIERSFHVHMSPDHRGIRPTEL
jgi:hypothetical protein